MAILSLSCSQEGDFYLDLNMIPSITDDASTKKTLYPFAEVRAVSDLRVGILTIREKWEKLLAPHAGNSIPDLKFPSNLVPSKEFVDLLVNHHIKNEEDFQHPSVRLLKHPWQIIELNDWAIREDFKLLTTGKHSMPIPETVQSIKSTSIFIEEGARLEYCILNASTGPIYIGKNAEVMEGSIIRGPFALGEGAIIKMGAKIYGATSIGPYSVAGGEIKNSMILGYSNKAHDGYLGDSVIGEWCNIGAGSSNSNLKNTATTVKVWHHPSNEYIDAGLKCGLMMGDYSRASINTSFNTGTVVGVSANVFGTGLTPKYIRDFAWGTAGNEKLICPSTLSITGPVKTSPSGKFSCPSQLIQVWPATDMRTSVPLAETTW